MKIGISMMRLISTVLVVAAAVGFYVIRQQLKAEIDHPPNILVMTQAEGDTVHPKEHDVILFDTSQASPDEDFDRAMLRSLRKAGSDLSQSHDLEFYLLLDTEEVAHQVAAELRQDYPLADITVHQESGQWTCTMILAMVPELSAIQSLNRELVILAQTYESTYDGWGTYVRR